MKTLYKTKPKRNKNKLLEKYFVLDVETNGLQATPDKFIFGCMVGKNYRKVFYSVDEFKAEFKKKYLRHKYIFAHNSEFDFSVIFGNLKKNLDRKAVFNGRFILAKKGLVHFADSFNIFPTSVKKIGESVNLPKLELDEGFKAGTHSSEVTQTEIDYCFRDCDIVYKALGEMFLTVGSVKPTLAGLALQMYRNNFQPFHIRYDETLCNQFFESYYGGRVECFKIGKTISSKYDVNSMYPFAMVHCKFPNPGYLKDEQNLTIEKLNYHLKHHEGLAEVTVRHKKNNFGFLPFRQKEKLIFPAGTFKGSYNFNELLFAMEKNIIDIISIHRIIYAPRMDSPFKDYVNSLYDRRMKATGIDNMICKLLLNTLYGKFAQREKFEEHYFENLPLDFIADLIEKNVKHEVINFNQSRKDCYVRVACRQKTRFHTIALFSSYITSFARVHLLKNMLKFSANKVTYLDTDCIAVENKLNNFENSSILGAFKLETDEIIEIYGNKSYKYANGGIEGKKLKGIPKGAVEISKNKFTSTKLIKTKEAIRRNLQSGIPVEITKELKFNYDKREIKKTGYTKIKVLG